MYPNQDQNQPEYPIDYLNQIAAPPPKKGLLDRKLLIVIGIGVVLLVVVMVMALLSGGGSNNTDRLTHLAARLQMLQQVSKDASQNIKDSSLNSTNSSLTILLTNAERDALTQLNSAGGNGNSLDKTIVAQESGTTLKNELEDARLNATFDRNYARDMDYQLQTVLVLLQDINDRTHSTSLKAYLSQTYNNLKPIDQQLKDFNKANTSL